jgi:hypothetical protein
LIVEVVDVDSGQVRIDSGIDSNEKLLVEASKPRSQVAFDVDVDGDNIYNV